MFKCQVLGFNSQLNEKPNKIVVKTREKTYFRWVKNEETREWENIQIGTGFETVKEINATAAGLRKWNEMNEEQRAKFLTTLK